VDGGVFAPRSTTQNREGNVRRSAGGREPRGQAILEFLIMIPFALVIILGVIQLALIFNAHSMMELAAFNAARAAIVAQGMKPEDPATVGQARDFLRPAHMAAVVTLLPVIPALHGTTPSLQGIQNIVENVNFSANSLGSAGALLEIPRITVDFIDPRSPIDGPAITNWPDRIDFDDTTRADANLVKVRVHWDYPLVIPFINRILAAIGNPGLYLVYKFTAANGREPTVEELLHLMNRPAWEYADFLARPTGTFFDNPLFQKLVLLRWPLNTTQVMRMQWDRKPNE
jgi:hypothetical protein